MTYTPIIGLEIHVELKTKSKMFCQCPAEHFQVTPNTHTCPVCLGLPGALPVANKQAIEWTQLIGLALNCQLATFSKFDRKHYFYPDLPKGYQISQYDQPLCYKGEASLSNGKKVRITRIHLEEDTAKNVHTPNSKLETLDSKQIQNPNNKYQTKNESVTLIDFNRSSVPLVEIVTEPDFRDPADCDEFLKNLRRTLRYLGVSDCDMEKGSMRLEVNMSLAEVTPPNPLLQRGGMSPLVKGRLGGVTSDEIPLPNYKVEVKNINSFRYVQKAIAYEIKRQSEILDRGETPIQETRGYQEDVDRTISQRTKEEAADYRYFPEPDIPPLRFDTVYLSSLKQHLPELPEVKLERYQKEYGLKEDTAWFLVETLKLSSYFEASAKICSSSADIRDLANAIKNKKYNWEELKPEELVQKIAADKASVVSDEGAIETAVQKVLDANPKEVERFKNGEKQLLGFFMGQVMRELRGKGDAKMVNQILIQNLSS